jgi:hypothetical protein
MSEPTHKEGWLMEIGPYGLGRMGANMVWPLPCCGEGYVEKTRKLFEEALSRAGSGES